MVGLIEGTEIVPQILNITPQQLNLQKGTPPDIRLTRGYLHLKNTARYVTLARSLAEATFDLPGGTSVWTLVT